MLLIAAAISNMVQTKLASRARIQQVRNLTRWKTRALHPPFMQLADFDFHLPDEAIALRPANPRDSARLLRVASGEPLRDLRMRDLPDQLRAGDMLVLNDTRVIPARLKGVRRRETSQMAVQATLHKRISPHVWTAFMKPGKRLAVGDRVSFGETDDRACLLGALDATVKEKGVGGEVTLAFDLSGPDLDAAIAERGDMPLPPYIAAKRAEDEQDRADYQTVYAAEDGSVAAPTAGLHFTPELLERLKAAGVETAFVTLHVGAGTFLPVKTDNLSDHRMHAEWGEVDAVTASRLNATRAAGGRIVCVGTTSLRLLESATGEDGVVRPFLGETAIFITPGYRFRAADGLLTNFHLPKSTLFMLVSALAGVETMRAAYAHAIASGYRFYSYGDGSLLWRAD
jgi:S-adenosylmethionine:tRNA ribosyltransferase-isomerase